VSSVMPEPIDVYVGAHETWVSMRDKRGRRTEHMDPLAGATETLKQLGTGNRSWRRPRIRIWLSGSLARPFVVGPVAGLRGEADSLALARSLVQERTGLTEPVSVWLDGSPARRAVLAVASEARLIEGLTAASRQYKVKIVSMRPWWTWAQQDLLRAHPSTNLLFVEDTDAATLLVAQGAGWRNAMTYDPVPSPDDVEALLERHALITEEAMVDIRRVALGADIAPMVQGGQAVAVGSSA